MRTPYFFGHPNFDSYSYPYIFFRTEPEPTKLVSSSVGLPFQGVDTSVTLQKVDGSVRWLGAEFNMILTYFIHLGMHQFLRPSDLLSDSAT